MAAAKDIIIPPYRQHYNNLSGCYPDCNSAKSLEEISIVTKEFNIKPTLIPTGYKCYMDKGVYLQLSIRSSSPLKYWIILANGVGVIDKDYVDNPDNEGEIFFQVINLSPFPIKIKKGEIIGQATFIPYYITDDDEAEGRRIGGFGSTTI